jgi:hypothetical protein
MFVDQDNLSHGKYRFFFFSSQTHVPLFPLQLNMHAFFHLNIQGRHRYLLLETVVFLGSFLLAPPCLVAHFFLIDPMTGPFLD